MTTRDFDTVLVRDSLIAIEPKVAYAVKQGPLQFTQQNFPAISLSTSQLAFNVNVPSELTVISRDVKLRSRWEVQLRTLLANPIDWANDAALAPFPASSLFTTIQASINNTSVSCQLQDLLYNVYIQSINKREVASMNSTAPTYPDNYWSYSDAVGNINNPLSSYANCVDTEICPRGSFYVNSIVATADATYNYYNVVFETTEPIFLSPFLFSSEASNKSGLIGITNLNFIFNVASGNIRAVRTAIANSTCSLVSCQEATLLFNFATCPSTQILPSHSVYPYAEFQRYLTPNQTVGAGTIATAAESTLTSQSITLNCIPDKLVICVRKPLSSKTSSDADNFAVIKGISINFANQAGILSGASKQQLFAYSKQAGSQQTWLEYSGRAMLTDAGAGVVGIPVKTNGSVLMLNFADHIALAEPYYAPGVLGQFTLQFTLQVENYDTNALTNWEICLITMSSGILVCDKGSTVSYVGILQKNDVIAASAPDAPVYVGSKYDRMVGGGFWDKLLSVGKSVLPAVLPVASNLLSSSSHPLAQTAGKVLGAISGGEEMPKRRGRHPKLM